MRIDNQNFSEANQSQWREPRFVFCVDFGDEDLYYLTSHEIDGLSGSNVIEGVLVNASGTSQKLNPDKANSEIGSISFQVLDDGLTDLQKDKLDAKKGLKGKRVTFYVGSADIEWADYIQATTQIVDNVTYKDRSYQFKCADIQRQMRKKIFEPKETRLTASLGLADGTIRALSTDEFQMVKQPVSPSGATAASGMTVGFIKVEGEQNDFEVIMYTSKTASEFVVASNESILNIDVLENAATVQVVDASLFRDRGYGQIDGSAFSWSGKEGNTLTGCNGVKPASSGAVVQDNYGRGALGTKQVSVEIDSGTDRDNAPKITEFVYLEMPAPMLAYAVLTGAIYGYPGDYLPDHWNLGIPGEYIRTTEFTGIGSDLWDLSDFDSGLPARFENIEDKDGKQFVEEQLFRMMGCYSPIYSDGQIGLRRMAPVVSSGGFVRELNPTNVADYSDLQHDMKSVINKLVVAWNYSLERDALTRVNLLVDPDSIAQHGSSQPLELEFYGLSGSRVSYPTIKAILDSLRDRYAGPPLRLKLTLTPDQNDLEIGDIVRVSLDRIKDYTGEGEGQRLERNFEIQNIQTDWKTGKVTVSLFGSSQRASVLPPDIVGSPIPNEWYEGEGLEISSANFPGAVESAGGITRVVADITLEGANSLSDGIFWCGEDLTIEGGVDVAISNNVQLRVRGFLQVNGTINGRGGGLDGGEPVAFSPYPIRGQGRSVADYVRWEWQPSSLGTPGFLRGDVMPQLGVMNDGAVMYHALVKHLGNEMRSGGIYPSFPALNLSVSGGAVKGLPSDLRGSGGPGGGPAAGTTVIGGQGNIIVGKAGGAGGKGGAGLAVICRGMDFGASAYIDLSGENGERGSLYSPSANPLAIDAYSGSGAGGGQGGLIIALDGPTATRPTIEGSTFKAEIGSLDVLGQPLVNRPLLGDPAYAGDIGGPHPDLTGMGGIPNGSAILPPTYIESGGGTPVVNRWSSSFFMQALAGEIPATPDIPEETENPASVTIAELTNTPRSANANLSTIEVAIQPPSVSSYKYALVEYREKGQEGWFEVGPASPEVGFVVPSDGKTYEIRARGVSLAGNVVPDAPIQEITTTKILNADPGDEDVDDVVEVPNVHGLELFEQGNDAVFGGRDAKFVWRKTSVTEWVEMGSEGQLGASRGSLDLYFKDYQVEIWADGSLVRTEWVVDPAFVYTYEKNAEDYAREQGQAGAWRAFECRVYCRGRQNQLSTQAAKLAVENVAPGLPQAITVSASFRSLQIDYEPPEDLDYKETRVWLSQSEGFTPGPANQVAQAYGGPVIIAGLADNTEYFLRFATYDAFGQGTMSQEFSVTTPSLAAGEVEGLSPWATVTDADKAFIDANLEDDAIEGTKIVKLTASKIVTGTLAATEKISVAGQVESVVGDAVATLGPKSADSKTGMITYQYDGVTLFAVYSDGSAAFSGAVTITEGSGYANLSDKPDSLNDINGSEYSQLGQASSDAAQALADAADAQAAADGKVTSFYQASAPTADGVGDLWVDSDTDRLYRWDGSTWVEIQDQGIGQALTDAAAAQGTADSKIVTFYQTGAPVAGTVGDLWVDTDDGNRLYRWNGSTWQDVHDAAIDQALSAAAAAQSTADGKIQSFYQNGEPSSGMSEGDLWFDTDDGNHPYRFNGSTWVDAQDSGISQALSDASDAQATADGKVTTFFATSTPTAEGIGDLWYNDSTKVMKRWNGTSWVDTATAGANWNSNLQNIPSRLGDTPTAGLNLTATHLGYYDGTNWRAFIENDGTFYFGDGDQKYLKFDGTDFTAGRETTLIGVDSYNGRKLYVHDNFLTAFVPDDNFNVTGAPSAALNRGRYSLWLETSENGDEVDFYHYVPQYIIDQAEASSNFRMKVGFSFGHAANGSYSSGDNVNTIMNMKLFSCRDSGANFCQAQYEVESDWSYAGSGSDREFTTTYRVRFRQGVTTETRVITTETGTAPPAAVIAPALGQFYGVECFVDLENDEVTISTPKGDETFSLTSTYTINDFSPGDALKVSLVTTGNRVMEAEAHLSDFYFMQE